MEEILQVSARDVSLRDDLIEVVDYFLLCENWELPGTTGLGIYIQFGHDPAKPRRLALNVLGKFPESSKAMLFEGFARKTAVSA